MVRCILVQLVLVFQLVLKDLGIQHLLYLLQVLYLLVFLVLRDNHHLLYHLSYLLVLVYRLVLGNRLFHLGL